MAELSRCGRRYPTFDEAYKAAELRSSKGAGALKVVSCSFGDHWHVIPANSFIGQVKIYRPDPFPPPVVKLIDERDQGQCQGCGRETRLERHHRRAKGSGGSKARAHTQCPCNALSLCRRCHAFAHEHPADARSVGFVVRQAVARPQFIAVIRYGLAATEYRAADVFWPTCDGLWVRSPGETEN